jgi:hypothetical protein
VFGVYSDGQAVSKALYAPAGEVAEHIAAAEIEMKMGLKIHTAVVPGQSIAAGDQIGVLGQTGNAAGQPISEAHVHMEIRNTNAGRGGQTMVNPSVLMNATCPWPM